MFERALNTTLFKCAKLEAFWKNRVMFLSFHNVTVFLEHQKKKKLAQSKFYSLDIGYISACNVFLYTCIFCNKKWIY